MGEGKDYELTCRTTQLFRSKKMLIKSQISPPGGQSDTVGINNPQAQIYVKYVGYALNQNWE